MSLFNSIWPLGGYIGMVREIHVPNFGIVCGEKTATVFSLIEAPGPETRVGGLLFFQNCTEESRAFKTCLYKKYRSFRHVRTRYP